MKDFIAYRMTDGNMKDICREYLDSETEEQIKIKYPNNIYEQSYAVIDLLINKGKVFNWSDMTKVLNKYNKKIIKQFTLKFKEAPMQGQLISLYYDR